MDGFVVMAGAVPTPCYVKNISFGGVYIKSNKEAQFQIGDIVELRITDFIGLVNGDILIIKGVIEHSVANGYGIRFYAPELEKYDVLTRMVFERDLS